MSYLLVPPSPNWFQQNALNTRAEDRLLVTCCFKTFVIYKIPEEKGPPQPLKIIPYSFGRVYGAVIYPDLSSAEFGHTFAAIGDQNSMVVIDMHSGNTLAQHQFKSQVLNSVCWGVAAKEADVAAAVGEKGCLVVWQPKFLVAKTFILDQKRNLTAVLVVPHMRNQVLVACEKNILLVSLQSGDILSQYKGHDNAIYSICWNHGDKNPLEDDILQANTRWNKDEEKGKDPPQSSGDCEKDKSVGPFFASSDFGRKILLWDFSGKRYITSINVPYSSSYKKGGKDRFQGKNHHISINFSRDKLYSSTVQGEILQWNLYLKEPTCSVVIHNHSRVVYNMETMGNLIITCGQDRTLQAYDVTKNCAFFSLSTIGSLACTMAFSPHDGNRLAIGMQDEAIRLLTFGGNAPVKTQTIHQNIKGRVMSLEWHPGQEGKLLYGTSDGQVGIADIFSNKVTTFAYFHQKTTYKVEWGRGIAPQKTGLVDDWYAYSFGDRELTCRNISNTMEDAVLMNTYLSIDKSSNGEFCLSEFAFSPDWKYIALGCINGGVKIVDCSTLTCLVVISRVRKVIQHLAWKPPNTSGLSYVLGIASGENTVYIFDLDNDLEEQDKVEPLILSRPKHELVAHAGRVIWLSWSPHEDGRLASASYDRTVQIWDSNTGEPVANYGSHAHRVFRVEFSPFDSDQLISFAEENCVHTWKVSKLTTRTPSESTAVLKVYRKKNKVCANVEDEAQVNEERKKVFQKTLPYENVTKSNEEGGGSGYSKKTSLTKKSSFPLLHNMTSKKKSFHHMCLLSLLEAMSGQKKKEEEEGVISEEDLDEDPIRSANAEAEEESIGLEAHVTRALERYRHFIPPDNPTPETEDICFYLSYFGSLPEVDSVVNKEMKNHESNENFSRANLMHCWQGSLESHIRWSAMHKRLNDFLVASAPQVSFELWEFACEAYAEQLLEEDDPVTAATYLLSVHKDEEAVNLLIKQKMFREALTIAKYKMGFSPDALRKVITSWYSTAAYEGNFELAALLQLCLGNKENAARTLARRTEASSLIVAAKLFLSAECTEMAQSTAILAFKEASNKNEFYKFAPILIEIPSLHWCQSIELCHQMVLNFVENLKYTSIYDEPSSDHVVNKATNGQSSNNLPKAVRQSWEKEGIVPENYAEYLENIKKNLPIQMLPTSLKNLWFLISISLSEMFLMTPGGSKAETELENGLGSILKYVTFWGKTDQIYYSSHILLPNGINDLVVLESPHKTNETSPAINQLRGLYISSEVTTILSVLESSDTFTPWRESRSDISHEPCNDEDVHDDQKDLTVNGNERLNVEVNEFEKYDGDHVSATSENVSELVGQSSTLTMDESNVKASQPIAKTCDKAHRCMFRRKEDFISTFEMYLDGLEKYSSFGVDPNEISTVVTKIIGYLFENKAISVDIYQRLLSKIKLNVD